MTLSLRRGARRSWGWALMLLAGGIMIVIPAHAQEDRRRPDNLPPGAVVQPLPSGASEELRRNLARVGENPGSSSVLVDAGRAALQMGDAQAALTFFSRAEEVSPRDPRVRAGMAAAMTHLGQAEAALTLFQEAIGFGAPDVEIAGDRGLAYDMTGDPARAQRDYALVLRRRDDAEVRRRMALSLAISGQREAALRMIEGQLRENDRAAWRTQAFVLALTGDAAGANRTAQGVMPPGAAQAMAPFFARLSALSPAQQARAVHLGQFPADGRAQYADSGSRRADPGALALVGGGPPQPRTVEAPAREAAPGRRRSASTSPLDRAAVGRGRAAIPGQAEGRRVVRPASRVPGPNAPPPRERVQIARAEPPPAQPPVRRFQPEPEPPAIRPDDTAASNPLPRFGTEPAPAYAAPAGAPEDNLPGFSIAPQGQRPAPASPPVEPDTDMADIAALVNALPAERAAPPPAEPAPLPASPPGPTERQLRDALARENERRAAASRRPAQVSARAPEQRPVRRAAQPAHPSRHWVQVAGGANRATLPREFARLRGLAPQLLNGRSAWTTPLNATNRLLVGPFASAREAQAFVNQLAAREISAFAWTSPAGQEIVRLPAGR